MKGAEEGTPLRHGGHTESKRRRAAVHAPPSETACRDRAAVL